MGLGGERGVLGPLGLVQTQSSSAGQLIEIVVYLKTK